MAMPPRCNLEQPLGEKGKPGCAPPHRPAVSSVAMKPGEAPASEGMTEVPLHADVTYPYALDVQLYKPVPPPTAYREEEGVMSRGISDATQPGETTLTSLPDEILLQVFRALSPACSFSAHTTWRAASALGVTTRRLHSLFRESLATVCVPAADASFSASELSALITVAAPGLRSLTMIRPWIQIGSPLSTLRTSPPPCLRSLTLSQLSARSNLHPEELTGLVRALGPKLETLSVGYLYPVGHLHGVLAAIGDACGGQLHSLSLDNLWVPPHVHNRERTRVFNAAFRALGSTLRSLCITRAQEVLFDGPFLRDIASQCVLLDDFTADGPSFASPYALSEDVASSLGDRLRTLSVRNAALCDMDAATLLMRCPRLTSLSMVCTAVTRSTFQRAISLHGGRLERLEMANVFDLDDKDVAELEESAPKLVDLRLRRCKRLSDKAFPPGLCERLTVLDVRDCPCVGDDTLHMLADVRAPLEEVHLNESCFSEECIAKLLRRCGRTLTLVDIRFNTFHRGPIRERILKLLALYCRSGVLKRALLE